MLFNSYEFIFAFLPFSFLFYFYLNHLRLIQASKAFLVFSSLFFYSWWNITYLPIILSSMLFNYSLAQVFSTKNRLKFQKKFILFFGVVSNLLLLIYFKYSDFFIENFNFIFNSSSSLLHLALPLAISFFTFQQIAYLVDSYKGETKEYDFLNYALFVTFFPQLIAGPIVHHKEMMPQFGLLKNKIKNYTNIATGLFIFSIGLFKKVVIADSMAIWAQRGFDSSEVLTIIEAWITSLSYTTQLYFDFSGYTDMAIGAALLFNIKLPSNFNSPYKAISIQDFWRRWHITLSRFLKEYIYIPLGGNRKNSIRTYSNLMITFLLGGIWHGAGWTFVFWGFLHGFALIIHRIWQKLGYKMSNLLAWFITFNFINITWVFFRAKEWDDAIKVLKGMFGLTGIILPENRYFHFFNVSYSENFLPNIIGDKYTLLAVILVLIIAFFFKNSSYYLENITFNKKTLFVSSFILAYTLLNLGGVHEFLYFNF